MLLSINDTMTVGELEDRFAECFPALKISFYSKGHKRFESSEDQFRFPAQMKIGDIRKIHQNEVYEIKSWFPVARVEKDLKEKFGLNIQIFRYNGNGKLVQTTASDELTLQQQSDLSLHRYDYKHTDNKHSFG
jgi:hypothetical protein